MGERGGGGNGAPSILIYTAAIGGGHQSLARAIKADLDQDGHDAVILDGLRELGGLTAWITRWGYVVQLRWASWSIRPLFVVKTHPAVAARLRTFYGLIYGWRLLRSIARHQPDLIVSTFPLITVILNWLERTGKLRIPVVTVIADYGAHALWVGPDTELHLVGSARSRELVQQVGGRAAVGLIPVAPAFRLRIDRGQARTRWGLPDDRFVVLIACGAWGVGEIEPAVAATIAAGALPVVVTGVNAGLRKRLMTRYSDPSQARILGWTDEMPSLMAAADCLVQNAGGMTCHEAAAMDLPVLFFRPIPGHGEMNAEVMATARAARRVRDADDLRETLRDAVAGRVRFEPPPRLGMPVAATIAGVASRGYRPRVQPRRVAAMRRRVTVLATILALFVWTTATPWTGEVGAMLLPPAVTARDVPPDSVALVVRVSDPATARGVEDAIVAERLPIAIFVDARGAAGVYPAEGVIIGVAQHGRMAALTRPWDEWRGGRAAAATLRQESDGGQIYVLPPRGGRTLLTAMLAPDHSRQVKERHPGQRMPRSGIVALDLTRATPQQAVDEIHQALEQLRQEGLACVPLPSLS